MAITPPISIFFIFSVLHRIRMALRGTETKDNSYLIAFATTSKGKRERESYESKIRFQDLWRSGETLILLGRRRRKSNRGNISPGVQIAVKLSS